MLMIAQPGEGVTLDGENVAENGALISISGASHIRIGGIHFYNVVGSGKSGMYISDSHHIEIVDNLFSRLEWTSDFDEAQAPTLGDRLNGIAVVGDSASIYITDNRFSDLTTGYGDPILVQETASVTESGNEYSNNDPAVFEYQQYYVSPDGSDDGLGTIDDPWQTIHRAMFSIPFEEQSAVINIRTGTYIIPSALFFDSLRGGADNKFFTVKAYNGEKVIIDGSLLSADFSAMVSFSSTAFVRIEGLIFTNLSGPKSGIYMEGTTHNIELINNTLHGMNWADEASEDKMNPLPSDNLNPIAVIGNDASTAIHSVLIKGNKLYDIFPGYSEGIKIVGNVTDFIVEDNDISEIANIGIVAAGNYTWVGIPEDVNHARNGIIRNNVVHNAVSPVANSAGIYLDGAYNVLVEGNTSHSNSVGFSVGCEQPGSTGNNTLRFNNAYNNNDAGLVVGTIHAGAVVEDTIIEKNSFKDNYQKGGWGGEITIQNSEGLSIQGNTIDALDTMAIVVAQPPTDLFMDNNLYHTKNGLASEIRFDFSAVAGGQTYTGLSAYQSGTCFGINSSYGEIRDDYFDESYGSLHGCAVDNPLETHAVVPVNVTASTSDENIPLNTLDNKLSTRWSGHGDGAWITYDLGSIRKQIEAIDIGLYKGDERTANFEIRVSDDAKKWSTVWSGDQPKLTLDLQRIELDSAGRYLRIVGYGNTSNDWNSITEVEILGSVIGAPTQPPVVEEPPLLGKPPVVEELPVVKVVIHK